MSEPVRLRRRPQLLKPAPPSPISSPRPPPPPPLAAAIRAARAARQPLQPRDANVDTPKPKLKPKSQCKDIHAPNADPRVATLNIHKRLKDTPSSTPGPVPPVLPPTTSTIRRLRVAFEDTPPRLRNLEAGWRDARKRLQDEIAQLAREYVPTSESGELDAELDPSPLKDKPPEKVPKTLRWEHPQPIHMTSMQLPTPPQSPVEPELPQVQVKTSRLEMRARCKEPHQHSPELATPAPRPHSKLRLSPILAYPLPPSNVSSIGKTGDTITVHPPGGGRGITLVLQGTTVCVDSDGMQMILRPPQGAERSVALRHSMGDADRLTWKRVEAAVTSFKRRTPRIKLYTPLGDLSLTCSEPPDIVLTFVLSRTYINGDERSKQSRNGTKVRLRYSLLAGEYVIDTAMKRPRGVEAHKSHRVGRLIPSSDQEAEYGALGINMGSDWVYAEKEAVRRLWALHDEWRSYVLGRTE